MLVAAKRSMLLGRPHFFASLAPRSGGPGAARPKAFQGKADRDEALRQWQGFAQILISRGIDVLAAHADKNIPDLALAGLAGFLPDRSVKTPVGEKAFVVAQLDPKQQDLQAAFARHVRLLGFRVQEMHHRFAGASDFFRCGNKYIYTPAPDYLGAEESAAKKLLSFMSSKPAWGSDPRLRETLADFVPGAEVFELKLNDPRFPRGDMVACALGEEKKVFMVYVNALHEDAKHLILGRKSRISDYIIPLSEQDAAMYAAGAIQLSPRQPGGRPLLLIPEGVSSELLGRLEGAGVEPMPVKLSEWIKKDRGGPSVLATDLGYIRDDRRTETPEVQDFRKSLRAGLDAPSPAN